MKLFAEDNLHWLRHTASFVVSEIFAIFQPFIPSKVLAGSEQYISDIASM